MLSTGSRSFSVLAPVMWPVAIRARDWGLGQGQWMLEQRGTEEGEDRGRKEYAGNWRGGLLGGGLVSWVCPED